MKKLIFILIILLLGGAAFYYFEYIKTEPDVVVNNKLQIHRITNDVVISPVSAIDNQSIWYFNSEGRLFEIGTEGQDLVEFPLTSFPSGSLVQTLWPKTGFDFIMVTRSGPNLIRTHYNSTSKLLTTLPSNVQWLEWLPDGKRVAYVWQSGDNKSQQLVLANADGSGFKTVTSVFWPDLALKSSDDGKTVLMYRTERVDNVNKIYAINLDSAVISTLVDSGNNLSAKWINKNKFIYSQPNKIFLYDITTGQSKDLDLNSTVEKVV
ncbi:MAG: hypothetical protein KW804_02375, partial [Candidatus Doudnabacteria bacterium]|nr:hypothetical protein [Candidatus Doudnabacteria bacterium]